MRSFFFVYIYVAAIPPPLNLLELPSEPIPMDHEIVLLQNTLVRVRGFWYPLSDGCGVLASHPHLKSCCVGNQHLMHRQIKVMGVTDTLPKQHLVELEGVFSIHSEYNERGVLTHTYLLQYSRPIETQTSSSIVIGSVFAICIITYLFFQKKALTKWLLSWVKSAQTDI